MDLSAAEYKMIVEYSPNMIWRVNQNGESDYFNQTWLDFTGRTLEQEIGDGWMEDIYPDDQARCIESAAGNFKKRIPFDLEYRVRRHDGQWRWIQSRNVPYYTKQGEFKGFIGSGVDVNDRVEGIQYKELAEMDSLTGAYSRRYLLQQIKNYFDNTIIQKTNLTIAMLDIDRFKHINDTYGHIIGDVALKQFTTVVRNEIRGTDLVGRYGGDEFVIIFHNATIDIAQQVIDRITKRLQNTPLKTGKDEIILSMSAGLCERKGEKTPEELLYVADQRMYKNKREKARVESGKKENTIL